MYLSQLVLDPRNPAVRRDLADCQHLHRTMLSAFPQVSGDGARAHFGVLHRLEVNADADRTTLLVQSRERPDWSRLAKGYLLAKYGLPEPKAVAEYYAAIQADMVLAFRLRANPTRKIDTKTGPDGQRRNGRRVELPDETAQVDWLRRKGSDAGFELLHVLCAPEVADVRVIAEGQSHAVVGHHRQGRLTFGAVVFEGHLRVTDADRFRQALATGIGSAKAYGFGLLSVAPGGAVRR